MAADQDTVDFIGGGGEMAALVRAYDWSNSVLGPPENWPQSLRLTVRLALNSQHPMFIWWGPELIQFYNDAYRRTLGPERHPSALGDRGRDCWAEIWHIIGPQIEHVMAGKGSTWDEERLVPVTRNGRREDVWWTYSYAPIDLDDRVGGVLVICNDVTAQHLARAALKEEVSRLAQLFDQAPGFMAVLRGPDHVFEFTNAAYRRILGDRDFVGRRVRDVIPEGEGQGFFELLDEVYATGRAHVGSRTPLRLQSDAAGPSKEVILDFVYQPIVEASNEVSGIFVEGVDVTEHVRVEDSLIVLNSELKHRVKNTLSVIGAIASRTLRGFGNDEQVQLFRSRLAVLGDAHDILTLDATGAASTHDIVVAALAPFEFAEARILLSGPHVVLGSKQALSLALALHELGTNAVKYGALSDDHGRVRISWETVQGSTAAFRFSWQESGGPAVMEPASQGFGSQLIQRVLAADFGGETEVRYEPRGLLCTLTAPLENLNPKARAPFRI
jgi:two-component sensor histidine kinase